MTPVIDIIDYEAGNLFSVANLLVTLGYTPRIIRTPDEVRQSDCLILPGVGAFGFGMNSLTKYKLVDPINHHIQQNKPFIGLCLGFQLLFQSSDEAPGIPGLGILSGHVSRLPNHAVSVPHMGWNSLDAPPNSQLPRFMTQLSISTASTEPLVYFVHSYCVQTTDPAISQTQTTHGISFVSSVSHQSITGCQFHPEKSGQVGINLLKAVLKN